MEVCSSSASAEEWACKCWKARSSGVDRDSFGRCQSHLCGACSISSACVGVGVIGVCLGVIG